MNIAFATFFVFLLHFSCILNIIHISLHKGGNSMRKNIYSNENSQYKIIAVDDESGILDSLKVFLTKARL